MNKKLINRILVSVISIPILILLVYVGKIYYLAFIIIVIGLSLWELLKLIKFPSIFLKISIIFISLLGVISFYYNKMEYIILLMLFLISLNSIILMLFYKKNFIRNLYLGIGAFIYPALSIGALVLIREFPKLITAPYNTGWLLGILLFLGIWICIVVHIFSEWLTGKIKFIPLSVQINHGKVQLQEFLEV